MTRSTTYIDSRTPGSDHEMHEIQYPTTSEFHKIPRCDDLVTGINPVLSLVNITLQDAAASPRYFICPPFVPHSSGAKGTHTRVRASSSPPSVSSVNLP